MRLLVPDTGKELARLNIPDHTRVLPQCFSPDGTRLIAFGAESGEMYVWDLRAIRTQLAERGLDWDRPLYPPAPTEPPTPMQIEVVSPQE